MKTVRRALISTICLIAVVFLDWNSSVYAQDISKVTQSPFYWINAGLGGSSFGIALGTSFSYQTRKGLISIRSIYNLEEEFVFDLFGVEPTPTEEVWDVGALYGISAKGTHAVASISGGFSIVGGVRRGRVLRRYSWSGDEHERLNFLETTIKMIGKGKAL